jgi:hypothetical protein
LELAGTVSALSNGSNRANVMNNSSVPGLLVSGTNQQVGNIDGTGATQVNAASDVTADHMFQGALVIGGTASSIGIATITASDALGNPLGTLSGLEAADSSITDDQSIYGVSASGGLSDSKLSLGFEFGSSGRSPTVPEPSAIVLVMTGGILLAIARHLSRRRIAESTDAVNFEHSALK